MTVKVPLLKTRCGSCRLLVIEGNLAVYKRFSCPKNRHIPNVVTRSWASGCGMYQKGIPVTKQMREDNLQRSPIFFTKQLGIRVTPDQRTVIVLAKEGFKLGIDSSQMSDTKVVITTLKKDGS